MTPDDPRHGTNAGYIAGCRLDCCKAAHADYKRGLRGRRYLRRADRLYIDATGTHRRIRALCALGYTYRDINDHAGWNTGHPGGSAFNILKHKRVHIDTAEKIRQVYDALSMKVPTGRYVGRQRRIAASKGWLPPLAYDDDLIDDPFYNPVTPLNNIRKRSSATSAEIDETLVIRVLGGENLPTSKAEKAEILRRWVAAGGTERDLCIRMGWRPGRYIPRNVGDVSHPETPQREAS